MSFLQVFVKKEKLIFNPFISTAPFLYPLKKLENQKVFRVYRKGALRTDC